MKIHTCLNDHEANNKNFMEMKNKIWKDFFQKRLS